MANTTLRQAKLRKLAIAPESTSGTYVTLDANTLIVPVIGSPAPTLDRGTGMIDRTSTQDGKAGDLASTPGSRGWSLATEMEIHDVASKYNYWVLSLLACGFSGATLADTPSAGDSTYRLVPTTASFANFSSGTNNPPATVSLTVITNNNEVEDSAQRIRGGTGVASFTFGVGEIAKLACAFKGLVVTAADDDDDFFDTSDVNVSAFGSETAWTNPYVTKNIVLTLTDANAVDRSTCLQSLTLNMNSNNPDYPCPSEEYGLDISPVFQDASPTFDLTIPSNATSDPWVWAQLRNGAVFAIAVTLQSATGRTMTVSIPRGQMQTVTWADANGIQMLTLNCKAVRNPGSSELLTIDYVFDLA